MGSSFIPLAIPPGVKNVGTPYSSKGRWYLTSLVRWRDGDMRPVGGWTPRGPAGISGMGRCIIVWRDNANNIWVAVGSEQGLYVQARSGVSSTITPFGYTVGQQNAALSAGYGYGFYGAGLYGESPPADNELQDCTTWALDTFGPYLIGVASTDNYIYEWQLNIATPAAKITNAPTCYSLVVTADHIIMALGANGDPRQVAWCDQADNTQWTASNTNTAGSNELSTSGRLMCGKNILGGTLLWTDADLWIAINSQNQLIYAFTKVGDACGIISRLAAVTLGARAIWMGENSFYSYNGAIVEPLDCEVADYVFSNINLDQKSKVSAFSNSLFNEIWWLYQSNAGTEIDSYVYYDYQQNIWGFGSLPRVSGFDRGVLNYPIMVGENGVIYEHETGFLWDEQFPFATSGPVEIGNGDNVACVKGLIPDNIPLGDLNVSFSAQMYPSAEATPFGPYTLAPKTDFLFNARQAQIEVSTTSNEDFRFGTYRLITAPGSKR